MIDDVSQFPKGNHSQRQIRILKIMISYLYFIQGCMFSLALTFPLSYSSIPQYSVMGLFTASTLPYSFKFVSAPLIQKYTFYNYGRRKTWTIFAQTIIGMLVYLLSYFIGQNDQKYAGIIFIFIQLFASLQDISVDAFAIKELKCPQTVSFLQGFNFNIGLLVGGTFFMQLISPSSYIGRIFGIQNQIINVNGYLQILCLVVLIPTLLIHLFYNQLLTEEQKVIRRQSQNQSLWKLITRYRQFFQLKFRVCRQIIVLMLSPHGINYIGSSFAIQLMKNYGFSRQLQSTLKDISIIPFMIIIYVINQIIKQKKQHRQSIVPRLAKLHSYQFIILSIRSFLVVLIFLMIEFIGSSVVLSSICILLLTTMGSVHNFIGTSLVNTHAFHAKYVGMYGTMMASFANMGRTHTLNLEIISYLGFEEGCIIGTTITIIWVLIFKKACKWVRQGKQSERSQISGHKEDQKKEN